MAIQSISNPFNLYAAKEVYRNPVHGTDSNTAQAYSDAQKENFFSGLSVGINYVTNGQNLGIQNRHANYRELAFIREYGYYPDSTQEWIG